ncbi:L-dopachrome tautomerase-related protein [Olivibacter sp. XZL3]|uniref:L-dopachrome tautomerase-related protein n=1 Tax=Olivibacter sp. XZL3 TaxID=1735116 RepID=UPI00197F36D7|nr:L-dopachrome tautomerase-related protein [Olivibacter sp. XZL3]
MYKHMTLFATAVVGILSVSCDHNDDNVPDGPDRLELVFADDTYQLTGVAITAEGRLFTNYPLWSSTYQYALVESKEGNQVSPYPNESMNSWQNGQPGMDKWVCVQAVYCDDQNYLWIVDPAAPMMETVVPDGPKLVKINPQTNTIERTFSLDSITSDTSYVNDVRVDTERGFAYMTNSSEGGILVIDINSGAMKQVLQNHYSVRSDPNYTFVVDGKELTKDGKPVKMHSDGIALTPDGEWLYYKPLTDDKLYRIATERLRNMTLAESDLEAAVEDLGHFTTTDGMTFDQNGNLYLGDIQQSRIMRISPTHEMTEVIRDERLIWPDSYAVSKDGFLYISCSQIQKQPDYNEGVNKRTSPYTIYRMRL